MPAIKSRRMRRAGHVARMGEERGVYRFLVGKPELKRPLRRPRRRWVDNIKMGVDKKNQLDVTFCILYFSSNSCSTCFGQPCAHHQELTTA